MQFFNPDAFRMLWLIPAILFLFFIAKQKRQSRLQKMGHPETIKTKLLPAYRRGEWLIRTVCATLVVVLAAMALARPQWGEEKKQVERKGIDLIFLLDTSLSMLAEDIKPNRFEKSKQEIKSLVRRLKGDRVGMVAFAGSGFLQSPLTLDYSAFFLFLDAINVGFIPDPGTSLDRAIHMAIQTFPEKNLKHKAIVLFTDGEDHEGGIPEAIEAAKKSAVRIYTIGVGTPNGDPIPLKDERGQRGGFKKDRSGQVVITKLNAPLLEKIAVETGGLCLPGTPGEQEVDIILKHMETLGQKQFKERLITEKEDHFQIFLIWSLFFLIAESLVRRTTKKTTSVQPLHPLVGILCFLIFSGFLPTTSSTNNRGNLLYKDKKYQSAIDTYRKIQVKNPDNPLIRYNLAAALYQTEQYKEASQHLEEALKTAKDPVLKEHTLYNYGNVQYRLGNFDKAIEAYQKALEIDPKDVDAKYNLEFLQKSKNRFEKKDQDRKKDSKQQQQNQQDQQQQQNQQQQQQKQDQKQQNQQQPSQDQQGQDQQNQDQQQGQDKQDQQGQDQKDQKPDQSQENKQQPQQPKPDEQQNQQAKPKEDEQEKQQPQPQPKPSGQEEEKPQPQPSQEQQGQAPKPLQGQMPKEQALHILDALNESEKQLQDVRRPKAESQERQIDKDW